MLDQTQLDIALAFALESRAAARSQAFALKAAQENRGPEARLFRALSASQSVAARRWLMLLRGKIGDTGQNLQEAFQEEMPWKLECYAQWQARTAGGPAKAFEQAGEIARRQEELYHGHSPSEETPYQVCAVCGCPALGPVTERCPVCGALPEKFQAVD